MSQDSLEIEDPVRFPCGCITWGFGDAQHFTPCSEYCRTYKIFLEECRLQPKDITFMRSQ